MGYILVVDDQEENRDMLSRRLMKKGFDTLVAKSGQEALNLIDQKTIDLVLLDIRMPGMDGNEVLEKIRTTLSPTELPVIMVTAETGSDSEVKSLGLGADDYVTKPVDFQVLLARLNNKLTITKILKEKTLVQTEPLTEEQDVNKINKLIASGENHQLEFKSTLRWNIHSAKIGKEIEIAWLKTIVAFLNTDGGTLLVGVKDDGSINGLTMDKFKSDDKLLLFVNSSIKELIGSEYTGHISYRLISFNQEKILIVECKSINDAVFLQNGKEEEFYARFGPSSGKLSPKEVIAYLKNKER